MTNYTTTSESLTMTADISVPAVEFDAARERAVTELAVGVKIDGFRPGTAPVEMIEAKLDANKVLDRAVSFLLGDILKDIIEKEKIQPIAYPEIRFKKVAKGNDLEFSLTFHLPPKVTLGDYKKIKVVKVTAEAVTDKKIQESIERIFDARKRDLEESALKDENVIYGADGQVLSKPEVKIDDEFAKSVGATDLPHLKELIKRDLEEYARQEAERKYETDLFAQLVEGSSVDVPEILVDDELNRIITKARNDLAMSGTPFEDYLKENNKTAEQLKEEWRPQAKHNVMVQLLLGEIGKTEKIEVTPEEVEAAMSQAEPTKMDEQTRADYENFTRYAIFQTKTLEHLKKLVTHEEKVKTEKTQPKKKAA